MPEKLSYLLFCYTCYSEW